MWLYIYKSWGGWAKKDCKYNEGDSERDRSTEDQLQCKQQYIHNLRETLSLAMAMRPCGHNVIMRYTK